MRKDVAVLMVLWVMCIPNATFICASATPNKLDDAVYRYVFIVKYFFSKKSFQRI